MSDCDVAAMESYMGQPVTRYEDRMEELINKCSDIIASEFSPHKYRTIRHTESISKYMAKKIVPEIINEVIEALKEKI